MTIAMAEGAASMPIPTFLSAGTGAVEAPISGTLQVPYPATVAAKNFLVMQVISADAGSGSITTPAGWTSVATKFSTDTLRLMGVYYQIAAGTETGNVDVTCSGASYAAGRIYRFSSGTGVEAAGSAATDGSGTGMSAVDLTTLGANRLALQILFAQVNNTIGDISGETNADYTEQVAEYASASGPVMLSCQGAPIAGPVAISGGSATLGGAGTYRIRIGFAIKP